MRDVGAFLASQYGVEYNHIACWSLFHPFDPASAHVPARPAFINLRFLVEVRSFSVHLYLRADGIASVTQVEVSSKVIW